MKKVCAYAFQMHAYSYLFLLMYEYNTVCVKLPYICVLRTKTSVFFFSHLFICFVHSFVYSSIAPLLFYTVLTIMFLIIYLRTFIVCVKFRLYFLLPFVTVLIILTISFCKFIFLPIPEVTNNHSQSQLRGKMLRFVHTLNLLVIHSW